MRGDFKSMPFWSPNDSAATFQQVRTFQWKQTLVHFDRTRGTIIQFMKDFSWFSLHFFPGFQNASTPYGKCFEHIKLARLIIERLYWSFNFAVESLTVPWDRKNLVCNKALSDWAKNESFKFIMFDTKGTIQSSIIMSISTSQDPDNSSWIISFVHLNPHS